MRATIVFCMPFLLTGIGFGCSGRNTDDFGGFLQRVVQRRRGAYLTLLRLQKSSSLSSSTYPQRKQHVSWPPGLRPIRKKIP
jgi:hypothetical protein